MEGKGKGRERKEMDGGETNAPQTINYHYTTGFTVPKCREF